MISAAGVALAYPEHPRVKVNRCLSRRQAEPERLLAAELEQGTDFIATQSL